MTESRDVVYEEVTTWALWVDLLVWGACLASAFGILRPALERLGEGAPVGEVLGALAAGTAVALLPLVLRWAFGRLRVRVTRSSLRVSLGRLPFLHQVVTWPSVEAMEPVTYSPLLEFGGWGVRWGRGGKRAWTIRGNRALVLHLAEGKRLYIGSEDPERLASRIRQVSDIPDARGSTRSEPGT